MVRNATCYEAAKKKTNEQQQIIDRRLSRCFRVPMHTAKTDLKNATEKLCLGFATGTTSDKMMIVYLTLTLNR